MRVCWSAKCTAILASQPLPLKFWTWTDKTTASWGLLAKILVKAKVPISKRFILCLRWSRRFNWLFWFRLNLVKSLLIPCTKTSKTALKHLMKTTLARLTGSGFHSSKSVSKTETKWKIILRLKTIKFQMVRIRLMCLNIMSKQLYRCTPPLSAKETSLSMLVTTQSCKNKNFTSQLPTKYSKTQA